ncbi:MAG: polyphosphate polymerase domain-containing protein [Firmicutes bacterium]|nr:polyphosphate polymerase domain-containing protein [Bacillota bacterium]
MGYQATFRRYEIKYLLNEEQKAQMLQIMEPYMKLDDYGRTTIRNIYFDTDNYRLIRHSLERSAYKEKLRIRSYRAPQPDDPVFVELKKKYQSVVYKRRLTIPEKQAMSCFHTGRPLPVHSQIGDEIEYFREYYQTLKPVVFLSYEREAYYDLDGGDFRVTFDENILYRQKDFSLNSRIYGTPLLEKGQTLMEIKTPGGLPLWMTHALGEMNLYKTSFSKYGSAYQQMTAGKKIQNKQRGIRYA